VVGESFSKLLLLRKIDLNSLGEGEVSKYIAQTQLKIIAQREYYQHLVPR